MAEPLTTRDIWAGYNQREVLCGLSLQVERGEIVALIGPNGVGKSTLLKVIAGALAAKSGTMLFNGVDMSGIPQFERARRGIGYLIQGGPIFSSLTVAENLRLAGNGNRNGSGQQRETDVVGLISDLQDLLGRRAGLLSAGQRQMLALGMVLMNTVPDALLLLDEPLAGLAPGLVDKMVNALRRLPQTFGSSILLVEQNLRAAIAAADRICVLKAGKIGAEHRASSVQIPEIEEAYFG